MGSSSIRIGDTVEGYNEEGDVSLFTSGSTPGRAETRYKIWTYLLQHIG